MRRGMSDAAKRRKKERKKKMTKVNDPTLAAMDELAYQEYRVRIGVMTVIEFKIWAHDEEDAVNKIRDGASLSPVRVNSRAGTVSSTSQPEVVSVQVGQAGGGAVTQEQALAAARIAENAQAQKNRNVDSMAEFNKARRES